MKYLVIVVLCCLAVSSVSFAVPDAGPVNSNSSATARAVLSYLVSLEGKNVITGQFGMFGSQTDPDSSEQQLNSVYQYTGVYPAMTGADFNTPDKPPSQRIPEVVDWLSLKWSQGYLVTASWHAPNPCDGAYNSYNWSSSNPFDLNKVLPGGSCRSAYISMLDQIASGLQTLQQRGVVVLWRPWHENNGEWFWWGNQTPAQFSALWVDMYNYFTYTKGLNNLLWVFSATTPWDQWALPADAVYPGDQYVDIVGLDEYMTTSENSLQLGWGTNPDASLSQSGYLQFSRIPKPMIIAEFGPIPASGAGYNTKAYNWGTLLSDLHSKYPRIVASGVEYVQQSRAARTSAERHDERSAGDLLEQAAQLPLRRADSDQYAGEYVTAWRHAQ
ncbi:MAG: glycosyl hydrolase [Anaerolineae bacterium]